MELDRLSFLVGGHQCRRTSGIHSSQTSALFGRHHWKCSDGTTPRLRYYFPNWTLYIHVTWMTLWRMIIDWQDIAHRFTDMVTVKNRLTGGYPNGGRIRYWDFPRQIVRFRRAVFVISLATSNEWQWRMQIPQLYEIWCVISFPQFFFFSSNLSGSHALITNLTTGVVKNSAGATTSDGLSDFSFNWKRS